MLIVSEAIVRGAIERSESRGSQWRFDHPEQEVEFGKVNFVTRRDGDGMRVVSVPLDRFPSGSAAARAQPFLRRGEAAEGISHRDGRGRRPAEAPATRDPGRKS